MGQAICKVAVKKLTKLVIFFLKKIPCYLDDNGENKSHILC